LPSLAQEKAATPAVLTLQPIPAELASAAVEAINEKFDEAFNKHPQWQRSTPNAILSSPLGNASGLPEIEKHFTNLFERYSPTDRSTK
jgi:hypothetical protein